MKFIDQIGDKNRKRKYDMFCQYFKPAANTKILDIGASEWEYRSTGNLLEKKYPYPERITALGVQEFVQFKKKYPRVNIVKYNGGVFPFKDKSFDVCWCNAVLEHVGNRENQEFFLREIKRVAGRAFVTTPNKRFIYEPHSKLLLFHYLPKKYFDWILLKIGKRWATGDYMHLLSKRDLIELLRKCNITDYDIIENKLLGLTVDFVIVF